MRGHKWLGPMNRGTCSECGGTEAEYLSGDLSLECRAVESAYPKNKGYKASWSTASTWETKPIERCFTKHPVLVLGEHGRIYGGSCSTPVVTDADVYVGFDGSMALGRRSFPWNPGHEFLFRITDGSVPKDVEQFKHLVNFLIEKTGQGLKVHVGCIGGHGRTGVVLAAMVAELKLAEDPLAFIRKNYCAKAVETQAQVEFLVKHFGCQPGSASKGSYFTVGVPSIPTWAPKKSGQKKKKLGPMGAAAARAREKQAEVVIVRRKGVVIDTGKPSQEGEDSIWKG